MLLPNKLYKLEETILYKSLCILEILNNRIDINVIELYESTSKNFNDISDFILALDTLFALNYLDIEKDGMIHVTENK